MKPTYEDLEAELKLTKQELNQTKKELDQTKVEVHKALKLLKIALDKIAELEEKLNTNSKNSSKPPSTDNKGNTPPKPPKKRNERKGFARASFPPEKVDKHVECTHDNCPHCGSSSIQLNDMAPEIWQQAELPEVKAIITEYILQKYRCNSCGQNSTANLPEGVPYSAFGPKLMGLLAALTGVFHLAKREAILLIKDLYDVDMGLGSVPNIEERVAKALDSAYERIHHFVINSEFCKHFDETGWRDSGKRHFVWLASCEHAAFYMIDRNRSSKAFQKLIGKESIDHAVTDRYVVYNAIKKLHQYCLAHLIREFRQYAERDGPDKEIGKALEQQLRKACKIHGKYRDGKISWNQRNKRLGHCKSRVEFLLEDGMANGTDKLYKLSENLLDNFEKMWTFMKISGMEPTNNLAERDMRKLVVWRKKSYGTRSERGKKFVERITTISQTLKRQNVNVLKFIQEAVICFYRKIETPLISEVFGY